MLKLGGHTALCKVQCTKVMEYCAREAAQIFGGLSYSRGGQGEKVERLNREVRAMAIPGGSEEIMLDLGVKQSTKLAEMAKMFAEAAPQAQQAKMPSMAFPPLGALPGAPGALPGFPPLPGLGAPTGAPGLPAVNPLLAQQQQQQLGQWAAESAVQEEEEQLQWIEVAQWKRKAQPDPSRRRNRSPSRRRSPRPRGGGGGFGGGGGAGGGPRFGGGGGEQCGDFKRGRCTRGAACRFSHGDDGGGGGPPLADFKAPGGPAPASLAALKPPPSMAELNADPNAHNSGVAEGGSTRDPHFLVMAPTRELAVQIEEEAVKFGRASGIKTCCCYGGASKGPQAMHLRDGVHGVIGTPGRINDFLEGNQVRLQDVCKLVLDEADRMLDMGFEPQIRKILVKITNPNRHTMFFTATWPTSIRRLASEFLRNPIQIQIGNRDELKGNQDSPLNPKFR
eukprot:g11385.t1